MESSGQEIFSLIERLKATSIKIKSMLDEKWQSELKRYVECDDYVGAYAFKPIWKRIPAEVINRLGDIILGPLFTSSEHPWPDANGVPMAPLIQIDLDNASKISGIKLDGGLIQVWMPEGVVAGNDLFVRRVPREKVEASKLSASVDIPDGMEFLQKLEDSHYDDDLEIWVKLDPIQMIGCSEPYYTISVPIISDSYKYKNITRNEELKENLESFDQLAKRINQLGRPFDDHFFGVFSVIQYGPEKEWTPLFCFEGNDFELEWGDGGNAQLFVHECADGSFEYKFDWSCT